VREEEEGKEGSFWTSPMMVSSSSPIPNSDKVANNGNKSMQEQTPRPLQMRLWMMFDELQYFMTRELAE
jgi:hypothetical protein